MEPTQREPLVWLVDPISYTGMAYSDVGQVDALRRLGVDALVAGSEAWILDPKIVPRLAIFRGTHGDRSRIRKGAAYMTSLVRLFRRVMAGRPDIVHWQYLELPVADALVMYAMRRLGIRQVYTAHELLPWSARVHHRWVFRRLYANLDGIVVHNADQFAQIVARFGVDEAKVFLAPLGDYALFAEPELAQSAARVRIGIEPDVPVALFFGAIRPSKGLDVLLRAWAIAIRAVPDAMLLVVGKPLRGMDAATITALIDELGIGDRVRSVLEQVDPADANTYYRSADVVVLPYRDIGTSGVLRYAYDSALPVVATAVGEHTNHVTPGKTGFLVPPDDVEALAVAIGDALRDRWLLQPMGRAAYAYASDQMGWLEPAKALRQMYVDLMGAASGGQERNAPSARS